MRNPKEFVIREIRALGVARESDAYRLAYEEAMNVAEEMTAEDVKAFILRLLRSLPVDAFLVLLMTAMLLTGCGSESKKKESAVAAEPVAKDYLGTYLGECLDLGNEYYTATTIIFEPGVVKIQANKYDDPGCVKMNAKEETTFSIVSEETLAGVRFIDGQQTAMTLTYFGGRHLEWARQDAHYGSEAWKAGKAVDIAGKRYSEGAKRPARSNGTKEEFAFSLDTERGELLWQDTGNLLDKQ